MLLLKHISITLRQAFVEHVQSIVASVNGQTAIKHAVKSWRASESTVYDMLDTIFTVLDRNMDKTTGVITRLLDLFEGEKKGELVEAWNGMKTEVKELSLDTMAVTEFCLETSGSNVVSSRPSIMAPEVRTNLPPTTLV